MTPGAAAIAALDGKTRFKVSHMGTFNQHELMRVHDIPTPPEKNWPSTLDAVIFVHGDFDRLGFDSAGFYVIPPDFHAQGKPPKNSQGIKAIGPDHEGHRLSWKPAHLHNSRDLAAYVEAVYERIWVEE